MNKIGTTVFRHGNSNDWLLSRSLKPLQNSLGRYVAENCDIPVCRPGRRRGQKQIQDLQPVRVLSALSRTQGGRDPVCAGPGHPAPLTHSGGVAAS